MIALQPIDFIAWWHLDVYWRTTAVNTFFRPDSDQSAFQLIFAILRQTFDGPDVVVDCLSKQILSKIQMDQGESA